MARPATKEVVDELASRVEKALSKPKNDIVSAEIISPAEHERIRIDKLYDAVEKTNNAMPAMVEDLLDTFFNGTRFVEEDTDEETGEVTLREIRLPLKPEEKRRIFETLAKFSLTDKRLAVSMDLLRQQADDQGGQISFAQLNINVLQDRIKPHGTIDERLRQIAKGGKDDEDTNERGGSEKDS